MTYRRDIDGLRALAVLAVVFAHARIPGFSGGFVGVDIFFVISGYLITGIVVDELRAGRFSLLDFYERRARRILPALFLMLAVTMIVGWVLLSPTAYALLARSSAAAVLFASNLFFWWRGTDYFSPVAELNPALHTWSLGVEEQFYLVFPLLLTWLASRRPGRTFNYIAALAVLFFSGSALSAFVEHSNAFFFTLFRGWELALGALLALSPEDRHYPKWVRELVGGAGLVAVFWAVATYDETTRMPGYAAAVPCLGALALLWTGRSGTSVATKLLSIRQMVGIGLISYSLYLWHWPILAFLRFRAGSIELPASTTVVAIGMAFALAWASWRFVERPFRLRDGVVSGRKPVFWISGGTGALLFLGAVAVDRANGVPQRLDPEVLEIFAAATELYGPPDCRDADFRKSACRTGDKPIDLLIWGDSHAGAIWPGVEEFAHGTGVTAALVWKEACPPLFDIQWLERSPGGEGCAEHNDAVIESIRAATDIGTVVLIARWPLIAEGFRPRGEAGGPMLLREVGAQNGSKAPEDNFPVYVRAVERSFARISRIDRRVIVLSDYPEAGVLVPQALGSSRILQGAQPQGLGQAELEARTKRANSVLRTEAIANGMEFVDIAAAMCRPDCPVVRNGRPLYMDDDHLSRFGAETFIPPLLASFF